MHAEMKQEEPGFRIHFTEDAATMLGRLEPEMRVWITGRIRALAKNSEGMRPVVDFRGVTLPMTLAVNRTVVGYEVDSDQRALTVLWVEHDA